MPRSDLPFGSEFSPARVELPVLLELAHEHGVDWKAFEKAVRDRYFASHHTSDYNRAKLANNTKLSLRAYGLIGDDDATLSECGKLMPISGPCSGNPLTGFARRCAQRTATSAVLLWKHWPSS